MKKCHGSLLSQTSQQLTLTLGVFNMTVFGICIVQTLITAPKEDILIIGHPYTIWTTGVLQSNFLFWLIRGGS